MNTRRKVTPTPSPQSQNETIKINPPRRKRKRASENDAPNSARNSGNDSAAEKNDEGEELGGALKRPRHDDGQLDNAIDNDGAANGHDKRHATTTRDGVENGAAREEQLVRAAHNHDNGGAAGASSFAHVAGPPQSREVYNDGQRGIDTTRPSMQANGRFAPTTSDESTVATSKRTFLKRSAQNSSPRTTHGNGCNNDNSAAPSGLPTSNSTDKISAASSLEYDRESHFHAFPDEETMQSTKKGRIKWHQLLSICTILSFGIMLSLLPFLSVIYTLDYNYNLIHLERNENDLKQNEKYTSILQTRETKLQQTERKVKSTEGQLHQSQQTNRQLRNEITETQKSHKIHVGELNSIIEENKQSLKETRDRLLVLRGTREHANSALDLAWLRMDEMMEENNDLSNKLRKSTKEQKILLLQLQTKDANEEQKQLRERELLHEIDSLKETLELAKADEKSLQNKIQQFQAEINSILSDFELLQLTHTQTTDIFLAPLLIYIQKLQHSSEQQHSIILELTSVVHSLHSSLELHRVHAEVQSTESINVASAIASAANEMAHAKEEQYIMERESYMTYMEDRLERLEDEALGAVQAVAEAAGRLEYERKVEEEGRWRGYVMEVEKVLGEIGVGTEDDMVGVGSSHIGNGDLNTVDDAMAMGMVEKSVLRAAISRRIEEGIDTLRGYVRPYGYFGEDDDSVE